MLERWYFFSVETNAEELIFFAREYHYRKTDIDELTMYEKYQMLHGEDAILSKEMTYYEEMTKYGQLGLWILTSLGTKDVKLEDLIGDIPNKQEKRELTEEEKDLIKFAKENGLKYKITSKGVEIKI